jgi:hypothetical protein
MGFLAILNVGKGDTKISFDKDKPEEMEKAKKIVMEMLRRGYAILVEAGEKNGKPLYLRATDFDPETCEYIVAGISDEERNVISNEVLTKGKKRRVKAEDTKAVGVARSAGGMSMAADSIEMENLRKFDKFAPLRSGLQKVAERTGEWAGIPMPLTDRPLVIEPTYPNADELMAITGEVEEEGPEEPGDLIMHNRFFSHKLRCDVVIWEKNGKLRWGIDPAIHGLKFQIATMDASAAWGVEQEAEALRLLGTLIPHLQFKRYLMTGIFVEKSLRSGLLYFFRKLRPTVVISLQPIQGVHEPRIIAALCMHPIAYYAGSWAGAMCPTDDVIAHLMLMRGDEAMLWKRCNQHQAIRPEAGL